MGDCDPRELTKSEILRELMQDILFATKYWVGLPRKHGDSDEENMRRRCYGLAFSILSTLDGCGDLPTFNLVPSPHPTHKDFRKGIGQNWYPECPKDAEKAAINKGVDLHELFSRLRQNHRSG